MKALTGRCDSYRIRKGDWRLFSCVADELLTILRIAPMGAVYR